MPDDLKKLVQELERILAERGGLLDAPARDAFIAEIEGLKRALKEADAARLTRLRIHALELLAALLSVLTNVMTLLK
jgi:hypothetical protein